MESPCDRDSYPIQHMNESIDSLGDATRASALDANGRNFQIESALDDRDNADFMPQHSLFRFTCMFFYLESAPETF